MADISDYQDRADAGAYASAGHMVIGLKAGEGIHGFAGGGGAEGGAHHYAERAERFHSVNCAVLHYHYGHPEEPHEPQMDAFWEHVRPHFRKGDALVLDVEQGDPWRAGVWANNAYQYLAGRSGGGDPDRGHHALLYTYAGFLRDSFSIPHVWLAAYPSQRFLFPRPRRNLGGGRTRVMWQFTDGVAGPSPHTFAGIGRCDGSLIGRGFARKIARTIGR